MLWSTAVSRAICNACLKQKILTLNWNRAPGLCPHWSLLSEGSRKTFRPSEFFEFGSRRAFYFQGKTRDAAHRDVMPLLTNSVLVCLTHCRRSILQRAFRACAILVDRVIMRRSPGWSQTLSLKLCGNPRSSSQRGLSRPLGPIVAKKKAPALGEPGLRGQEGQI